jgi:branched-chain amino acid aminotransferase
MSADSQKDVKSSGSRSGFAAAPVIPNSKVSKARTFFEGDWHEGNAAILGAQSHATWLGSIVFDGGRAFEGVTPDLDRHFARVNKSAESMCLKPIVSLDKWLGLTADGLKRFDRDAQLYIRPMYWADAGLHGSMIPDAETTRWCLSIYEEPLPEPRGSAITLSPLRRPPPDTAPVEAKAACLYPNNWRALAEAKARGFDNCILRDALGNVSELASANIFIAKDGIVFTPAPNGAFLNGITRQRVIALLREAGVTVVEKTMSYGDFQTADEIFSTGNHAKVSPITRIDQRLLRPGRFYRQARELYWSFALRS